MRDVNYASRIGAFARGLISTSAEDFGMRIDTLTLALTQYAWDKATYLWGFSHPIYC